ncbi:aminotransferase class V-fold PLP-dependent enzyme [Candidatus Peregrinibacteria bacterium]|jgi:cysteine desulfurase|nr:aminotransferase class V-fold PLP-dependent enzyme [Candidatus Peregrinibacteria bacterium]MBT4456449.1 aminotransferase class V-fold PLP-dependent enzyme [Candidatus Peregrinibacteria bacterium]
MKRIYLDHAATTYVDPKVLEAMLPYFTDNFGNPNSIYTSGLASRKAIEDARTTISEILNCEYDEIIFTGSGTESDNLAIFGTVQALAKDKKPEDLHLITSAIEHNAVQAPFKKLEKEGYKVTYIKPQRNGLIDPKDFEEAITDKTAFASIIYANNEIGTIQPIAELTQIAHRNDIIFHTDACQAAGALTMDTQELDVNLLTLNASKIYGPKGIGVLFKASSIKLEPQIIGGGQESNLRSGTENVPGIVGMAKALELAQETYKEESARLTTLRNHLIDGIEKQIPRTYLNGDRDLRLPNNANILILDIEGEALLLHLDDAGIEVSTGSACDSKSLEPSHVLTAIGLPKDAVHGSIRFTLGKKTTKEDIDYVLKTLPGIVENLRKISPVRIDETKLGL